MHVKYIINSNVGLVAWLAHFEPWVQSHAFTPTNYFPTSVRIKIQNQYLNQIGLLARSISPK